MGRRRWLDVLLLAAIAPLGVWAWRSGRERTAAEATYARLTAAVGDLDIADPSKVYLRAMPTGDPLRFAWRAYLPAGPYSEFSGWGGTGMTSSGTRTTPCEGFLKVRISERPGGDGFLVHHFSEWSSGSMSMGDRSLVELLRGRWDRVEVEQAGAGGPVAVPGDQTLVLLRLKLPPDLAAEAKAKLSPHAREFLVPGFFEYRFH